MAVTSGVTYTTGSRRSVVTQSSGSFSVSTVAVPQATSDTWVRDSSKNDNYAFLIANGKILPHCGLIYDKVHTNRGSGNLTIQNVGYRTSVNGSMHNTSWAPGFTTDPNEAKELASMKSIVDLKLLLAVKDQKVNIANLIAERDQTLRLFASTAQNLASAINNLRHGNLAGAVRNVAGLPSNRAQRRFSREYARDRSRAIANAWIGLQYGWKPLISECQGAAESLAKLQANQRIGIVTASQTRSLNYQRLVLNGSSDSNRYCTTGITVKGSILFEVDCGWAQSLAGIGLTNPLSPAWELLPWSFVVDWFIPVGNTIAALDATLGVAFRAGSLTSIIDRNISTVDIYNKNGISGVVTLSRTEKSIKRSPMTGFPSVPIPQLKSPLSWMHAANSLALAVQRAR